MKVNILSTCCQTVDIDEKCEFFVHSCQCFLSSHRNTNAYFSSFVEKNPMSAADMKRRAFASKKSETVETGIVKYDADEAAEVAILSRDCMKHLGDWYYPEGGWGWIVVMVSMLTSLLSTGMIMGGGHVMVASINKKLSLDMDNITGVLVTTGTLCSVQLWSPLATHLVTSRSPRLCSFFGALIMALAWLFTSFAHQLHQIVISYNILLGLGVSITQAGYTVIIGQYFKKNRAHLEIIMTAWMGVGQSLASLLQFWCFQSSGWRLGLQTISACVSLCVLTSLVLRPASVYHPQRHAILHMRQYMRQVLGKTRYKKRTVMDTMTILRTRAVKVILISGMISAVGLYTPLLSGSSIARHSGYTDTTLVWVQVGLGLAFAMGSYSSGRLCLIRHKGKNICVTLISISGVLLLLVQICPLIIKLFLCSLLAGAISTSGKVYLYKSARYMS